MNKYILGFIIFILLAAGIIVFLSARSGGLFEKKASATIDEQKFTLEIADTDKKRQVGLSEKRSLKENEGMLFLFDTPGYYSFWMKNMDFPIDIIFLNDERVVTVYKDVPNPQDDNERLATYTPTQPANRVIELRAGTAEKVGIAEGDTIDLSL